MVIEQPVSHCGQDLQAPGPWVLANAAIQLDRALVRPVTDPKLAIAAGPVPGGQEQPVADRRQMRGQDRQGNRGGEAAGEEILDQFRPGRRAIRPPQCPAMVAVFESGRLALSRNREIAGYRSRRFSFLGRRLH